MNKLVLIIPLALVGCAFSDSYNPPNSTLVVDKEVQGTAHKKDLDMANRKTKLQVEDVLENKYQQLIESYRNFSVADPKISPERKVKNTIQEIAKKLQEIETMVNYNILALI